MIDALAISGVHELLGIGYESLSLPVSLVACSNAMNMALQIYCARTVVARSTCNHVPGQNTETLSFLVC